LRGLVKDITDLEAYINVKGALRYLLSIGDIRVSSRVVIAGNLRPSTNRSRPSAPPTPLDEPASIDWQQRKAMLMRFFTAALGFDDIVRINVLDGMRVYFRNGDVAHVRSSGNAPQLRIYANSDSQARADQIVELALREPDGILRQLERAFT
jgi:Phosphoglucomutase/phosphomannomutase, C-terminal domain